MVRRVVAAGCLMVAVLGACGESSEDPGSASSCKELMERAAVVTRGIVDDLDGLTVADLDRRNPDAPYEVLTKPYEGFRRRASELGCDEGELRRLACDAYRGLKAEGPVAEEFLASFVKDCR